MKGRKIDEIKREKKNWTLTNEKKKKKTEEVRSKYRLKNWIVEVTDEKTNKQKQKPYKK